MIHVYAFADELGDLPPLDGIDGAPLERRTIDGLEAVFSRRTGGSEPDSLRSDAIVHGKIVEALAERAAAVLPVRFTEESPSNEDLDAAVGRRAAALKLRLEQVRGCVELGLRIVAPVEVPTAATGAEFMHALRDGDGAIHDLHRDLVELSREASLRRVGRDRVGAYLLPREGVGAVQALVERFARERPGLTVLCTGPWAPYSFAGTQS